MRLESAVMFLLNSLTRKTVVNDAMARSKDALRAIFYKLYPCIKHRLRKFPKLITTFVCAATVGLA